jgi:hypothetical protein
MIRFTLRGWLPAALVLLAAVHPAAAQAPFDACRNRDGSPIPAVVDDDMPDAGIAMLRNGRPVIMWNARANARLSGTEQLFIYLHECGHHMLAHLYHPQVDTRAEIEADCWAIQLMMDGGMIQARHLAALEASRRHVRGDHTHLGGAAHVRSLEQCLAVRTDARAWAAALDTVTREAADSFAGHRGWLLDSTGTPLVYEALVDLPGTYHCEVVGIALRSVVFAARKEGPAVERYRKLVPIIRRWLPAGWTATELPAGSDGSRTFQAQDGTLGTLITLAQRGTRVYVLVKLQPV